LSERMAADLRKMQGVTDTLVTIGSGQQQLVNVTNIYVKLSPIEERSVSQQELMLRARSEIVGKYLKEMPQLRTAVNPVAAISGGGFRNTDIQFVITDPDLHLRTTCCPGCRRRTTWATSIPGSSRARRNGGS